MELPDLPDGVTVPGAIGAAAWLFWRLVLRADRREQEAFRAILEQRDEWRERAEDAERRLADCLADLLQD